eukprot:6202506-Pleurochrysis_carterae.AAC.5
MADGPLGELLAAIETMSEANELNPLLKHLQQKEELLIKHLPLLDDVLPVLSASRHTLAMVFILCALLPPQITPPSQAISAPGR